MPYDRRADPPHPPTSPGASLPPTRPAFADTLAALESDARTPRPLLLAAPALLLLAWGAWATTAAVPVQVTSTEAHLASARPALHLEAPVAGIVTALPTAVGERVAIGEPLAVVEQTSQDLDRRDTEARLHAVGRQLDQLAAQTAALDASRRAHEHAATEALAALDTRLGRARAAHARERTRLERIRRLVGEGVEPATALEDATAAEADTAGQCAALERERSRTAWTARAEGEELTARAAALAARRTALEGTAEELRHTLDRLDHETARRTIRSPVAGTVGALAVPSPGARLAAGDPVATIVPVADPPDAASAGPATATPRTPAYRVDALFPAAAAVGRIRPGQSARVLLDALPSAAPAATPADPRAATAPRSLAATVERVGSVPVNAARPPRVRVHLALHPTPAQAAHLHHGMTAEVRVTVETVRPATLLLRALGGRLR